MNSDNNRPTGKAASARRVSTRRLGAATMSSIGVMAGLAVAAAPAAADRARHNYFDRCLAPGNDAKGSTISTPPNPFDSYKMSNWGYAGSRCNNGGNEQGWTCITEFSEGANVRGPGKYYCVDPNYWAWSRRYYQGTLPNGIPVSPAVRVDLQHDTYGHVTKGSSANSF